MKKQNIRLYAFIAIIVFVAGCNKSETIVDKLAAYDAEKEQIMTYVEKNNLENYSTTINTELTKAERLMYVNDIPSNTNVPDINLVEKLEMQLEENHFDENKLKGGSAWGAVHLAILYGSPNNTIIYYGYSKSTGIIPYLDIISDIYFTDMNGRWHIYHDYSFEVDAKKAYDLYQFNPAWGLYYAYGDHWFEFGGGSHAQIFTSDFLSYYD